MPTGSVDAGEDACVACVREVDFTSPQLIEIKLLLNDYDILDHVVRSRFFFEGFGRDRCEC